MRSLQPRAGRATFRLSISLLLQPWPSTYDAARHPRLCESSSCSQFSPSSSLVIPRPQLPQVSRSVFWLSLSRMASRDPAASPTVSSGSRPLRYVRIDFRPSLPVSTFPPFEFCVPYMIPHSGGQFISFDPDAGLIEARTLTCGRQDRDRHQFFHGSPLLAQ